MFTGIIRALGTLDRIKNRGGDRRFTVDAGSLSLAETQLGDSIAVNGVCLTVIELGSRHFAADVSNETLTRTTFGQLALGARLNLELSLLPTTRLGGHLVSGHVDGVGTIIEQREDGRSTRFVIEAPAALAKYIAEKGSICVDGISLTVNSVEGTRFGVNVVPHTLAETTLGESAVGHPVNLEVDILARYLERLLLGEKAAESSPAVTLEMLQATGFVA